MSEEYSELPNENEEAKTMTVAVEQDGITSTTMDTSTSTDPPSPPPLDTNDNSDEKSTASTTEGESSEPASGKDPTDLLAQAVTHKDEGNNLFKSGDLTKASRSYRKGTSLLKNLNTENTGDEQVKALLISLQTNLSMVCFKQNKYQQSRDVASKALDVDSTNVKALYRRAVACRKMGDVDSAKKDLKLALQCDPNNRDVKKELLAIKKELDKEKMTKKAALSKAFSSSSKGGSFLYDDKAEDEKKKAEKKAVKEKAEEKEREKRKAEWEDECVHRMSRGEDAIIFEDYEKELKKKKEDAEKANKKLKKEEEDLKREEDRTEKEGAAKEKKEDSDSDTDDDELTEKELQMLRGYKKTSDGRTTSYFSREQTAAEKMLLGNIAPQRLNASPPAPQRLDSASASSSKSSSVWNQAGTWEEKDASDWCNSSLTSYLKEANVEVDTFVGRVEEVKDLSGDASVAFVSGKKRYVFDYNASLKYAIANEDNNSVACGTLKFLDISSTAISDELEVDILAWKKAPSDDNSAGAHKCRDALVNQIRSQVLAFVSAFNGQY